MSLYRITKPDIKRIALVKRPASGHRWHLFKSGPEPLTLIQPIADDWQVAYTVVAAPGHVEDGGIVPGGAVAKDASGEPIMDVWDEDAIRQACHSFAENGGVLSDVHFEDGSPAGVAAESFLAPADYEVDGQTIRKGSWVLGVKPASGEARAELANGGKTGVSVEGSAVREPVLAKAGGTVEDVSTEDCGCTDELEGMIAKSLARKLLAKATLSAKQRKNMSSTDFALPGGRYPIPDRSHAINALARVAQNGTSAEQAAVKRAVCRKFPGLPSCKS